MAQSHDYIPIRTTRRFAEAQSDEGFRAWLAMQSAVMEIVFGVTEVPELGDVMFTEEGLTIAEAKLLDLYRTPAEAYEADNLTLTMRFVYYIGETFRRAFDGEWVAVPRTESAGGGLQQAIDLPFREGFVDPLELVEMSLGRRSGNEISTVYGFAAREHARWIAAGRPERVIRGTLRESDT